jgi:hypothetical protein
MNRGMYGANNGVIGNIWRQKVSQSHKESMHPIPQLDEDVYNLFNAWNFDLTDNADDINNFIINLKCELGIQQLKDVFDCFYVLAAATQSQSLTNWAQPGTYDLTIDNTTGLVFTTLKGWRTTANGSAGFLNTNFNPNAVVCNFNNNVEPYNPENESATQSLYNYGGSIGIYTNLIPTAPSALFMIDIGSSYTLNGNGITLSPLSNLGIIQLKCYGSAFSVPVSNNPTWAGDNNNSQAAFNAPGFYSLIREGETSLQSVSIKYNYYINGTLHNIYRGASNYLNVATASSFGPIIFPGTNIATSYTGVTKQATQFGSTRQYAFVFIGSKSIDQSILHNNLNNYLTSIDAAVVNS